MDRRAFVAALASGMSPAKSRVLYAEQAPFQRALLAGRTTHAAWRSKPSWYAVSTEDRTINPDLERFMARRMGATTLELKASHLSLISQPDAIAKLILAAAGQG
jgi:pimeloyl-ACP methyl ester carboxylesterase